MPEHIVTALTRLIGTFSITALHVRTKQGFSERHKLIQLGCPLSTAGAVYYLTSQHVLFDHLLQY
jgi:hypothetical protein